MNHQRGTIPCTVGILTFNSETFLERCLQGLSDFSEILIADGGSTDATLEIAQRYGCRVITQSNPGHPITDFALERNRMVDAANNDWFLSLDSDELITPTLVENIREVTQTDGHGVYIYRVPYRIISEDLKTIYASFKPYYQHRFFNKKSGARYTRKVHERITFDTTKHQPGTLIGCWHVPLDIQLDFKIYKQKVDHRIRIMVAERPAKNIIHYIRQVVINPLKNIAKQLIKFVWLRLNYPSTQLTPARYEAYKLYSQYVFIKEETYQYIRSFRKKAKHFSYFLAYLAYTISKVAYRKPEVVVLMYHEIDESKSKLAVTPLAFEKQLLHLRKTCEIATLDTIYSYIQGLTPCTKRTVALTFDDGYRDLKTTVLPLLQKYNMQATVFVPSDTTIATNNTNTPRLSAEELVELTASGHICVQSHSKTHRQLPVLNDEQLRSELTDSKKELEQLLQAEISYFAYPYGARNDHVEQAVADAGYKAAFSITEGTVKPGDAPYHIKRVQVDSTMSRALFAWRLTRAVDIHKWTTQKLRAILS